MQIKILRKYADQSHWHCLLLNDILFVVDLFVVGEQVMVVLNSFFILTERDYEDRIIGGDFVVGLAATHSVEKTWVTQLGLWQQRLLIK